MMGVCRQQMTKGIAELLLSGQSEGFVYMDSGSRGCNRTKRLGCSSTTPLEMEQVEPSLD